MWWWVVCALVVGVGADGPQGGSYRAEAAVLLNEAARKDRDVSYRVRATLHLAPLWRDRERDAREALLHLRLVSPKLYLKGKHVLADYMPHESIWDSYGDTSFYVHLRDGLVVDAYLDPEEPLDVLNYKKSLASLFQVRTAGAHNESDSSGDCRVLYETISPTTLRKIKVSCADEAWPVRRVTRYSLSAERLVPDAPDARDAPDALDVMDAVQEVFADELVSLGAPTLGLKARSWLRLARQEPPSSPPSSPSSPSSPSRYADLHAALEAIPAALQPLPLALTAPPDIHDHDDKLTDEELVRAVSELGEALEEGEGGGEGGGGEGGGGEGGGGEGAGRAAALVWRAVRAVRAADATQLSGVVQRAGRGAPLEALARVLGLAGTTAAHRAAERALDLEAGGPLGLAYLSALALCPAPGEDAVRAALRLGGGRGRGARAALLAAGAAARASPPHLQDDVRHALVRSLARCQEEECREGVVSALGNLRRADCAALLLDEARRAPHSSRAGLAALDALHHVPLGFERLDRLGELALDERAPLELRAAALDLVVRRRASLPAPLARLAYALYARRADPLAHELRRVLWQRWAALAPHHDELRRLPAVLEPALRGWDALAHAGTSSVVERALGWGAGGWGARLDAVHAARGGALRRGAVTLRATHAQHAQHAALDVLAVRVWARGLDAFGGDEPAGDGALPAEEAGAGLAFEVGGSRVDDVTLFAGRAELLGHVWAGTASTPTPALRALLPLAEARGAVRLAGGAVLAARSADALALALDAQAQASLWYRSAHARLELRAAAATDVHARLPTAWGELSAHAHARAASRLRLSADLEFQAGVALCVRAATSPSVLTRRVELHGAGGARRLRVSRVSRSSLRGEGRTLALGRPNDALCRHLAAQHHDD